MEKKLNIVEAYHSLQGEGTFIGRPSIFIRIAGCNQACVWCDTPQEGNPEITEKTISDLLVKYHSSDIVITGGEPTADIETLTNIIDIINETNHTGTITIETNGTKFLILDDEMEQRTMWSVSPKLHSSGENYRKVDFKSYFTKPNKQFKFVISNNDEQDMIDLESILVFMPENVPIILQPVATPDMTYEVYAMCISNLYNAIMELELNHYIKIIPQVHKFIWGFEAQGV